MALLQILFWYFVFLIGYTFFLYPCAIIVLSKVRPSPWKENPFMDKVSLIIAAHNEESVIRQKLINSFDLDLGDFDCEIIVISDGSTDATNSILNSFASKSPFLKTIAYGPREGKATALNRGIEIATGDVLAFSDANVILNKDTLVNLLKPFSDPAVGAVCGKILVKGTDDNEIAGESVYMKYEGAIQRAEAHVWSMPAIDGALFALRKNLYRPLDPSIVLDDFALSMEANLAGKRVVYADEAKGVEEMQPNIKDEFKRKARIIAGGFQYLKVLLGRKNRMPIMVWISFMSHKVIRWFAGWAMLGALVCNLFLLDDPFLRLIFILQAAFYGFALVGQIMPLSRKIIPFYLPYYFCVVNYSAIVGLLRFATGNQGILWKKVER